MIDITHLSKAYGDKSVLEDISLSVADGSIYGLVGYNGAGKTTLLSLIAGLLAPDSGCVTAEVGEAGEAVPTFDSERVRRELFLIADEPYILPAASLDTMAAFYRGFYPRFSEETYTRLADVFGLDRKSRIAGFSKGMKRQAAITLGLSVRPRYLLLDESFDGLDPSVRGTVCDLLMAYMADTGATVIMASHNISAIEHICDTVGMLDGSRIVFSRDMDELRRGFAQVRAAFEAPVAEAAVNTALEGLSCGAVSLSMGDGAGDGRVLTLVTESEPEIVRRALGTVGAVCLFESEAMTLEEIFTYENTKGGKFYDIHGLFGDA